MRYTGKPATIRGGASTVGCGVDANGSWLSVTTPGDRDEIVRLPGWKWGVGGMELVLSPDERYVALFIYSGQSTQGYELFALQPTLARIGGLAEAWGHGDAPAFSPDGGWLVTFIDDQRLIRETGEYFETVQDAGSSARVVVNWARLHVQRLPEPAIHSVPVGVEIPLSTDIDVACGWNTYDAVRFASEDVVVLHMPWGEELAVPLPPPATITASGFVTRP